MTRRGVAFGLVQGTLLAVFGCAPAPQSSDGVATTVRLADVVTPEMLVDPVEVVEPPRSEWRLAELADGWSWRAPVGVEGAAIGAGGLRGTAAMPRPVVVLEAPEALGGGDRLYAVEVRMRASAGKTLRLTALGAAGPPAEAFAAPADPEGDGPPFALQTPLLPGDETETYRIDLANAFPIGPFETTAPSRVVLRPTDAPGAEFEIESVRLVFRREHLASVPSGLDWHGLGEVWRESLVTRPGESLVVPVRVPAERPVLDLAVGTPADAPTRFRVAVRDGDGEEHRVLQRVVTRGDRWEPDRVDLSEWAGEEVELVLASAPDEGAPGGTAEGGSVGLWGAPAIRSRWSPDPGGEAAPQGVILVIADTLRRDHLDAWGYERETAPHLTRLAGEGVRFADAVAQAPWTKVSVPSLLTSVYPTAHGIVDIPDRLPSSAVTLAEAFREAGYATMATSSWAFTGQLTNLHQGVEVLHEGGSIDLPEGASRTKTMRWFTDRVLEFVEGHREEPFLAVLHVGDPHSPYRPMDPYAGMWTGPGSDAWHAEQLERARPEIADPFFQRFELPTTEDLSRAGLPMEPWRDHEIGWYDGSIRALDTEIGRLVDRLDHLGLTDRVVIAFVSDHGEEFFEHGWNWHGLSLYGHQTDVPFVLWGPGFVPAGVTVETPVALLDLQPTLLSLAGLPRAETAQGRDLLPLVEAVAAGEAPSARGFRVETVFAERTTEGIDRGFPEGSLPTSWAVVTAEWRLIRNPGAPEGVPELELYDRRTDPLSLEDVAGDHPEVVARLAETLAAWRSWVEAHRLPEDSERDLSSEDLERLRSLGYL
jgi:arylsulfatase A-like enzyme